jgi:hypothetical protein
MRYKSVDSGACPDSKDGTKELANVVKPLRGFQQGDPAPSIKKGDPDPNLSLSEERSA